MFEKTGSRIKQFISPRKNREVQENEDRRQKRQLKPKTWRSPGRKPTDEAFVGRTNHSATGQISSPPLPSPLSTQHSLRSFCECGCNSPIKSPPHSFSKFHPRSGTLQSLCPRPTDSSRFILVSRSSSPTKFLPPNTLVNSFYRTASTSQIDLLEALALEPVKIVDETLHQEYLTMRSPKSCDVSKNIQHLVREANHATKAPESVLTSTMATSQELYPSQDETNPFAKKMSPRNEPRRRYRIQTPPTVIISQPESTLSQSFGKLQQHEEHRQHGQHDIKSLNFMDKPPASSNSSPTLDDKQRSSLAASSCERFPPNIVGRRAESDSITYLSVESFGENNLRPSSETSCSTTSGSTASTALEPFHLEDLPLRIRLAEGLIAERHPGIQSVEIRQSTASTLTIQTSAPPRRFNPSPYSMEIRKDQHTRVSNHEVVLKSTNFSLTSLGYKHGDIRVQKCLQNSAKSGTAPTARSSLAIFSSTHDEAESCSNRVEEGGGLQDGGLDEPRFQTAISGAWMKECEVCLANPHPRLNELEVKVDELVNWCDDFCLDVGRLVKGHLPREKRLRDVELRTKRRRRRQLNLDANEENALSVAGLLDLGERFGVDSEGSRDDLFSPPPNETPKIQEVGMFERWKG